METRFAYILVYHFLEFAMTRAPYLRYFSMAGLVFATQMALAAPGEDTIHLKNPVEHLQLPINNNSKPQGLDNDSDGIPPGLKAKIARYEAKTFNDQADGIYTDGDVKRMVGAEANRKTCIQDVGSNTAATGTTKYGPNGQQQIVVLRGDLVNICR